MSRSFEVREVAELLGVAPRRVEGWVERGLLKATRPGSGPGRRRRFATESLLTAMLLLRVQTVMGERNEELNRLIQEFTGPLLRQLISRLDERAEIKDITLVVSNYAGAHSNVTSHGNPEYQVELWIGRRRLRSGPERERRELLRVPLGDRSQQPIDPSAPPAPTWSDALRAGASVTFFDLTGPLQALRERLHKRNA